MMLLLKFKTSSWFSHISLDNILQFSGIVGSLIPVHSENSVKKFIEFR